MQYVDDAIVKLSFEDRVLDVLQTFIALKQSAYALNPNVNENILAPYIWFTTDDDYFRTGSVFWATPVSLERGLLLDVEKQKIENPELFKSNRLKEKATKLQTFQMTSVLHVAEYVDQFGESLIAVLGMRVDGKPYVMWAGFVEQEGTLVFTLPRVAPEISGHLPHLIGAHLGDEVDDHELDILWGNAGWMLKEPENVPHTRDQGGAPKSINNHKIFIDFEAEGADQSRGGLIHYANVYTPQINFEGRSFVHVGVMNGLLLMEALDKGASSVTGVDVSQEFVDVCQERMKKKFKKKQLEKFKLIKTAVTPEYYEEAIFVQKAKPYHSFVTNNSKAVDEVKIMEVKRKATHKVQDESSKKAKITLLDDVTQEVNFSSVQTLFPTPPDILRIEVGGLSVAIINDIDQDYLDSIDYISLQFGARDLMLTDEYDSEESVVEAIQLLHAKLSSNHIVHNQIFIRLLFDHQSLIFSSRKAASLFPTTNPMIWTPSFLEFELFATPKG